jgi:hypothetical protein
LITRSVFKRLLADLSADAEETMTRIARTTLFTYRPVKGFVQVQDWLQLRPVACELKGATGFGGLNSEISAAIPYPFVIEVAYRSSTLSFLEAHRRIRALQEAVWLLSAFIDIPVFSLRIPYSWIHIDGSCQLARCGMTDGLETSSNLVFSDVKELSPLTPIPIEQYFRALGITTKEFRVPGLSDLYSRYKKLSDEKQLRFLRACASLAEASNPTIETSQKVVSLVSTIESLLDPTEKCDKCTQRNGITKQFKTFLDQYVPLDSRIRELYMRIYQSRSQLVHGSWNFDVDEPTLGLSRQGFTISLATWDATKRGIINWLLSQPSIPTTKLTRNYC